MARQLKDVGEEVSDVTVMAKILGSLPTKYNVFVTAWDSVGTVNQTISNLTQRLIKEETQLYRRNSERTSGRQHEASEGGLKKKSNNHTNRRKVIANAQGTKITSVINVIIKDISRETVRFNDRKCRNDKKHDASSKRDAGSPSHDAFVAMLRR